MIELNHTWQYSFQVGRKEQTNNKEHEWSSTETKVMEENSSKIDSKFKNLNKCSKMSQVKETVQERSLQNPF